jgi:hypothetical protein
MLQFRDQLIDANKENTNSLAAQLASGDITLGVWVLAMRQAIKDIFINQYMLAHGGRNSMTQADFGRLGQMIRTQYAFLENFANDIASGRYTEQAIAARARMYMEASGQAFERGKVLQTGMPDLPAYPSDGSTQCLCITSPRSRVLTRRGWIAIANVQIGDYVLTHRLRWRKVLAVITKESIPSHKQVYIRAPVGEWVGATDTHLWYTNNGWQDSTNIDRLSSMVYHISSVYGAFSGDMIYEKTMSAVRCGPIESEQANIMSQLPISMRVRESEGSQSGILHLMRDEQEDYATVGGEGIAAKVAFFSTQSTCASPPYHRRFVMGYGLATSPEGWPALDVDLGGRTEANNLSIPMGMDKSQWQDSASPPCTPQERKQGRRPLGEFGIIAEKRTRAIAWQKETSGVSGIYAGTYLCGLRNSLQEESSQGQAAEILFLEVLPQGKALPIYLSDMRGRVLSTRKETAEILFAGVLPQGTTLYDLTVEEDHSFVIEGLFAHNSNCKCNWRIVERDNEWDCYWQLSNAEHCPDCLSRAGNWNPLVIPKTEAFTRSAVMERLQALA